MGHLIHDLWSRYRNTGDHSLQGIIERLTVANELHHHRCGGEKPNVEELLEILRDKQGYRCAYCPAKIMWDFQLDHIFPVKEGGEHRLRNIAFACPGCNNSKRAGDPPNQEPVEYEYVGMTLKIKMKRLKWKERPEETERQKRDQEYVYIPTHKRTAP